MIKIFLKYNIFELAINTLLDKFINNFNQSLICVNAENLNNFHVGMKVKKIERFNSIFDDVHSHKYSVPRIDLFHEDIQEHEFYITNYIIFNELYLSQYTINNYFYIHKTDIIWLYKRPI